MRKKVPLLLLTFFLPLLSFEALKSASAGPNLIPWDQVGETPLHRATKMSREDMVDFLLESGVDVNVQDRAGATPLHWAAYWGRNNLVSKLLNAGADKSIKDKSGRTPYDITTDIQTKKLLE